MDPQAYDIETTKLNLLSKLTVSDGTTLPSDLNTYVEGVYIQAVTTEDPATQVQSTAYNYIPAVDCSLKFDVINQYSKLKEGSLGYMCPDTSQIDLQS